MTVDTLVAGIGNIFLGDDGFGCEVVRRLSSSDVPKGVRVVDYGIRGMHLAYDLIDGWDLLVLVDALPAGVCRDGWRCSRSVRSTSAPASPTPRHGTVDDAVQPGVAPDDPC